jgi:hypothetical protein
MFSNSYFTKARVAAAATAVIRRPSAVTPQAATTA